MTTTTSTRLDQDCMLQWLSISEETLFLHDGLMRVTELVELPHDVSTGDQQLEQEVVSFDSKTPDELSERLRTICGTQNSANARLLEYRLNALRGFWAAIRSLAFEVQREKLATREALSKKPCQKETEAGSFSTQVSLLLVLPLLQSQSRLDNTICGVTTSLLLKCLHDCSPLSLRKEMSDCLDGLESLLSTWLGETTSGDHPVPSSFLDPNQQQNTASALVALACARGFTYAKNADVPIGWLACNGNILLHRPQLEFDAETGAAKLANIIDKCTLELVATVVKPVEFLSGVGSPTITVNLLSDGSEFYWVWTNSDKNSKIFMDVFKIHETGVTATAVRGRLMLQKKEEAGAKATGELGSLRLRTFQPGNGVATAMIALTPSSDAQSGKKEEASGSSVGISLKILLKSPMFCDGNTLVLLTNPVGGNLGNTARTLFGSTSTMNNARVLAVNNCFHVIDGQFVSRVDLLDAPNSALSKLSSISGIGVCYDATNSVIWCCTNDYIDQFLNPGHQAKHHVLRRLGLGKQHQQQQQSLAAKGQRNDAQLSSADVIRCLLQHVGCMCLHELSSCANHSLSGLSFICLSTDSFGCSPGDRCNLCDVSFVCDIIEKAVTNRDELVLTCCLILIEYLFQMNAEIRETLFGVKITQRLRELIWRSFDGYRDVDSTGDDCAAATLRQICQTLTCGLCILYKTSTERTELLHKLICTDDKSPAFHCLRQLILIDFANQLRNPLVRTDEEFQHLWLSDEMIGWVLNDAVAESCVFLRQAKTIERKEMERILASVPGLKDKKVVEKVALKKSTTVVNSSNAQPTAKQIHLHVDPVLPVAPVVPVESSALMAPSIAVEERPEEAVAICQVKKLPVRQETVIEVEESPASDESSIEIDVSASSVSMDTSGQSEAITKEEAFSNQMYTLMLRDIDEEDGDNPQLVSEYAKDIYHYMMTLESQVPIRQNHLSKQPEVNARMRCILVDWLIQVHQRFHLLQETLFLTVAILDRYLQSEFVPKTKLQLVGVASMWMAAKYEEMYAPEVADFAYITDHAYTKAEIRSMECAILRALNFSFGRPLPIHFLRRFSKAGDKMPGSASVGSRMLDRASGASLRGWPMSAAQSFGGNLDVDDDMSKVIVSNISPALLTRTKMQYHCKFGKYGNESGQFTEPSGVAVNHLNEILVADDNNHRIQVFDRNGNFKCIVGHDGKGEGDLVYPNRLAVNMQTGDIYVTERSPTHQVQVYNQHGRFIRRFGAHILQHPCGITIDKLGRIIVVECKVMRVVIFSAAGTVINRFIVDKRVNFPKGVAVNDTEEIFISDNRRHGIVVFNYQGQFLRTIGGTGLTNYPIGVSINSASKVVFADNHNDFNVTIFWQDGQLVRAMGSGVKDAQCFVLALMSSTSIVMSSKDVHVYV